MKPLVSFVIPCYRSEATLPGVIREIQDTMEKMKDYGYEIVLVNDCSPDGTFSVIRKLCQEIWTAQCVDGGLPLCKGRRDCLSRR